jgi:hypothetical protein
MKVGMQRVGFCLAVAMTTMLGGCGWFDSSSPVDTASVRPGSERAVALSAALPAGGGNRQYAAPDVPVDETRSAQIGSIVQGKGGQKAQFDAAAKETAEEERKARVETDRVDEARRQADAAAAAASPPKASPPPAPPVETVASPVAPTLPESPPLTPPPAIPPASTPAAAVQPPVTVPSEATTPVTSTPPPVAAAPAAPVAVVELPTPPVTPAKPGDVNKAFQPPPGWTPPTSAAPAPAEAVVPRPAVAVAEPAPSPAPPPAPPLAPVVTPTMAPATSPDANKAFQPPAGWTPPAGNTSVVATTVAPPAVAASPPPPPALPPPPAPQATAVPDEVPTPQPTRPVPEPVAPPSVPKLGTVSFRPQSAVIGGPARAELDRLIERASGLRSIELRAFASDANFSDARNTALARGLSVRSYLMDRGLRARIEIGAFAADGNGPGTDRVDVWGQ